MTMELRASAGAFLVSVPQMMDPNFMHSVVLVCEHSAEGAVGLVVNRRSPATVRELLPDHPVFSKLDFPVFGGGPVGLDTLQFVHRAADRIAGGYELSDGIVLGGSMEDLARFLEEEEHPERSVRLFLGYSGWGEHQLDGELETGSWVPAPPDPGLVFSNDPPEAVWRRALRSIGSEGEGLSQLPPDVSWN